MTEKASKKIEYPYIPEGRIIEYVGMDNPFMQAARDLAREFRGALKQPNGVVLVKNGEIIGRGSIGMGYHASNGCERIKHNMPTGQGYDLCPGCAYTNHGEATAVRDAEGRGVDTNGSDAYLWGHWWCCEPCWKAMIDGGLEHVYLLEGSEVFFNSKDPNNKIGQDF